MSQKNTLVEEDVRQWGKNLLYFTAPTLAIFFGQLAIGVDWRAATAVAVLALYGALADIFKKYKAGPSTVVPEVPFPKVIDVQQTDPSTSEPVQPTV